MNLHGSDSVITGKNDLDDINTIEFLMKMVKAVKIMKNYVLIAKKSIQIMKNSWNYRFIY